MALNWERNLNIEGKTDLQLVGSIKLQNLMARFSKMAV